MSARHTYAPEAEAATRRLRWLALADSSLSMAKEARLRGDLERCATEYETAARMVRNAAKETPHA